MRRMHNTLYPRVTDTPVFVGYARSGRSPCFVGGVLVGQQSRSLTWEQMKEIGGTAVRAYNKGNATVDGAQVRNVEDGFQLQSAVETDPASGNGFIFRNSYMTYIRDDCIEDDDLASGIVYDVLFDGCFVGFSASHDGSQPSQAGERIVLDHALIRLQKMPGPPQDPNPNHLGHGEMLKWDSYAPRPAIRNSVFLVEDKAPKWPPGTTFENSAIVYTYTDGTPPKPRSGLAVTKRTRVWDRARQDWLNRHGCTGFGKCSRLTNPFPPRRSQHTYVAYDCAHVRVEPQRLILRCGRASYWANHLHWPFWGKLRAAGHGVFHINDCKPTCSQGTYHRRRGKLLLQYRRWCPGIGRYVFRHARAVYKRPYRGHRTRLVRLFCPATT
jgi:hypothetical protein